MGKFEIGERVRYTGARELGFDKSLIGKYGTVTKDDGDAIVNVDWEGATIWSYGVYRDNIVAVGCANDNPSPVRTVTRRKIVPGVYGGVQLFDDFSASLDDWSDAQACRSAARIFNEIADVLDEQKEAA